MHLRQATWRGPEGWQGLEDAFDADVVFVFGDRGSLADETAMAALGAWAGAAPVVGCSTAGQIAGVHVEDPAIVATALRFDDGSVQVARVDIDEDAVKVGGRLAEALPTEGLRHVIVFSDGLNVNGSALAQGMRDALPPGVQVTGGLAGDGSAFKETVVVDGACLSRRVVGVGLYGPRLHVGYGSLGGWDAFGPRRRITRSEGNVLYELDGRPALDLYKQYLGEHVKGLPATGLLFPLSIRSEAEGPELVRTILAVDDDQKTMTFAGDLPEGAEARLMKANFDRLIDGAHGAAEASVAGATGPSFALLISCVGRRLVLKQRVEEELEAVREVVGEDAVMAGFYSYGEICPAAPDAGCQLHNQTMTITTLWEE